MDRQRLAKAKYEVGLRNRIGSAQNLYAGAQSIRQAAAGQFVIRIIVQSPCLLETVNVTSSAPDEFVINDISVAGQSTFTSNGVAYGGAFDSGSSPAGAFHRALGISVIQSMQIVITGTTNVASNISAEVGISPLKASQVQDISAQAYSYNFCHGLGQVVVPAIVGVVPGVATLTSLSNRETVLGLMILGHVAPAPPIALTNLYVTSIQVDSLEMLNSQVGAQEICVQQFNRRATTIQDNLFGYSVGPQSRIDITFANYDPAAVTMSGAIFLEQWKP